jgi:DNA uptake protein ComE-like DNA-binding protein
MTTYRIGRARLAAALILTTASVAGAQVGKMPAGMVETNTATEAQLAALPGMTAALAKTVVGARPFSSILALDSLLGKTLTKEQRTELYKKTFVPINLNTATREEIMLIPGAASKHVHEFQEYRPYKALAVFHREMRKYWDEAEVNRLESYVYVPLDLNSASDADIMTIPGMSARMLREFKEYRPYDSVERYTREMRKYVDEKEAARLTRFVTLPPKSY